MISRLTEPEVSRLRSAPLTYVEVGQTRGDLPPGYQHLRISRAIGTGEPAYDAAAAELMTWRMHERSGLRPRTDTAELVEGSVAVLRFGWGPLSVPIPVRVVHLVESPRQRGFAYGTLPGHPEQGEEAFVVEWQADGTVVFTVTAFSRPGRWFTRIGGPVGRGVQRLVTQRYLVALQAATRGC